jgi:predicted short-subunit dehydrogenase-like oxidoreductase (DUF2520 family)
MPGTGKPVVTLVGGGRLGATLGYLLGLRGYPIESVTCTTEESARRSAGFVGEGVPVVFPDGEVRPTGLVLVCVPDDAIPSVARTLAGQGGEWSRSVVLHCSGRLPSETLEPLRALGAAVGSMHPLQAFSAPSREEGKLEGTHVCVEGDPGAVVAARQVVLDLGGHPFDLPPGSKPLYHAAAALASNGVVACHALAIRLLVEAGQDGPAAGRALLPLLLGTARNLQESGPGDALTGPVARGDIDTVEAHLGALGGLPDPVVLDAYRALSRVLLDLARQGDRIAPEVAERLEELLDAD